MSLLESLAVNYRPVFRLEVSLQQRQILEIFEDEFIPTKKSAMVFFFGSSLQYFSE